ncbi:hypothetical protein F511_34562 [Dorcoceras hygrometricum]|uniref:Dystroglycan-like n=1 Tax=Dorcoceras hygrometricum TaxID=472368 RepID=A0A2Z7D167_9LAMI|nr:hypothetical protein F511_34562 [Dorcoceras hygrometricum]
MAASFYSNSVHVDFDSVLAMSEPGMVSMFQALVESGLQGFLGCTTVVYEEDLVEFFANGAVRDGLVVSSVNGVSVEISEKLFAETFDLPVVGLADVSEMPKDKIFDARSIVSLTGEPVILSGSKSQMKMHYRLLCDIMAKSISVKAGSFNALTVEKFSLLTAVVCNVGMNWGSVLFGILKKMVTPGSKQAKGFAIQISLLLESFPNLGLGESSEFPSSKILTEKTTHRYIAIIDKSGAQEPVDAPKVKKAPTKKVASKKRPADISFDVPVLKKKRTSKRISTLEMVAVAQEAEPIHMIETSTVAPAVEVPAEETRCSSADDVDVIIQQVIEETREVNAPADKDQPAATEERHWFDLPYEDLIEKWAAERPVVTASDTDEEDVPMDVGTADEDQQKSLEDILLEIPVDVPLPSSSMEITKIKMGGTIKIPGVTKWTWFLNSLPRIPADDKGKEILVEKNPIKGNPAQEHFFLICADIDLLVALRAKVIDDVALFLNSFSLKKLATINIDEILKKLATINIDEMYKKEEQVLAWGETELPQEAIQRKTFILLKYRRVLVWKFLESWRDNFVPGQGSSAVDLKVIELLSDLHFFILEELAKEARAHGLLWKKTCCSKIFEGSSGDRGAVIHQQVISNEVHRQRQYDDTLPTVSEFFRLMRKRWADVSLEIVEFCTSRRLLPIGSLQFCRSSSVVGSDFRVAPHPSPIFAFRVSQFCSIFVDFSVFNWFPSSDISDFLSSIALERTAFRDVQRSFAPTVVPSVQFSLDQRPPSPTSTDSSSSLRFDTTDVDATVSSLPPVSQDVSAALADLQAILSEQINESQSGISSKLHKIEQVLRDSLSDQAAIFKNLSQEARQEGRTIDDVQTMRFNEFRKNILAQNASIFVELADVRKEVQEAQENQNILHAQLSELVDYIHRDRADKKGESGSRGLQQTSNVPIEGSTERTPTFAQRVEMAQRHIVHTVLDADANRALLERQAATERDRERRRREARMLKMRRRD